MKNTIISALLVLLIAGCNSHKKQTISTSSQDSLGNQAALVDQNDLISKRLESMKKLTPFNADQVRLFFPDQLNDMKRTDYQGFNNEGYEVGEAVYGSEDGTQVTVTILDCAGEAGAGKYNIMFAAYLDTESSDDAGYKKSIKYNGEKAIESFDKGDNKYSLLFPAKDRLLVNIESASGVDLVRQAATGLHL